MLPPRDPHLPPQLPPPRKAQPGFLPPGSTSIQCSSSQAATQWPLSAVEPGVETEHTASLTYFLFPPSGSGWVQSGHILTGAKREGGHSPSPFRLSTPPGLTPPRQGGALPPGSEGRGEEAEKTAGGPPGVWGVQLQSQGHRNCDGEVGRVPVGWKLSSSHTPVSSVGQNQDSSTGLQTRHSWVTGPM